MMGLCKACGVSYPREHGVSRKFCSSSCKLSKPKRASLCRPLCAPETLRVRPVTFSNGSKHHQRYCVICTRTIFVSYEVGAGIHSDFTQYKKQSALIAKRYGHSFYASEEWVRLRFRAFQLYGRSCMCCRTNDGEVHVDHIKPRSKYPALELDINNLQVLCRACNLGKSADSEEDYRPQSMRGGVG